MKATKIQMTVKHNYTRTEVAEILEAHIKDLRCFYRMVTRDSSVPRLWVPAFDATICRIERSCRGLRGDDMISRLHWWHITERRKSTSQ